MLAESSGSQGPASSLLPAFFPPHLFLKAEPEKPGWAGRCSGCGQGLGGRAAQRQRLDAVALSARCLGPVTSSPHEQEQPDFLPRPPPARLQNCPIGARCEIWSASCAELRGCPLRVTRPVGRHGSSFCSWQVGGETRGTELTPRKTESLDAPAGGCGASAPSQVRPLLLANYPRIRFYVVVTAKRQSRNVLVLQSAF